MKIKREINGQTLEFELTFSELTAAYDEYNLDGALADMKDIYEQSDVDVKFSEESLKKLTRQALHNLSKNDSYFEAYWETFNHTFDTYINECLVQESILKPLSLNEQIGSAENVKNNEKNHEVGISYEDMVTVFRGVENKKTGNHVVGHIVFTINSFDREYSEESRTYVVSSDNKAFQPGMGGYSIYGSSLDGKDLMVRLEQYMAAERGGKDGWKIERCYMTKDQLDKANHIIDNPVKVNVR